MLMEFIMKEKEVIKTVSVRMPKSLIDWLEAQAKEGYRGLSGQVCMLLDGVKNDQKPA